MKTTMIIISIFLGALPTFGQTMRFEYHEIGEFGYRMGQTSLVDVDNDHDLDWVFGQSGELFWYEYNSSTDWKLHEIGKGAKTDVGGCPTDVNHDGWVDFVVGDSWYESTGNPKEENFILHQKNMIFCHDNVAVDIDGDGIKDIVSMSNDQDNPVLAWYKIPKDIKANWDYSKIGKGIHGGVGPFGYGDLDNDGDIDIVRGDVWFENSDSKGGDWEKHETLIPPGGNRPDKYGLAFRIWCFDIDNDNDLDIVEAEADTKNGRVFWYENINDAENFIFHPISADSTNQDFHSLALADFDNDGDMDVLSGGGPLSQDPYKLFVWENISADGLQWIEHIILEDQQIHEAVAADVDKDGDIDICTKPWHGERHIYLENKLIE